MLLQLACCTPSLFTGDGGRAKIEFEFEFEVWPGWSGVLCRRLRAGRVVAVRQFMHCFHQHNSVWLWISSK
uniref:HDC09521 n=1 Tax=Drosophila melanogaster TaxID=7227 RepID=Q6ILE5_DROME|nr:TPA_inf: HDC09521 [Drosophila melanogaster]